MINAAALMDKSREILHVSEEPRHSGAEARRRGKG